MNIQSGRRMQWAYSSVAQPIEGKGFAVRCSVLDRRDGAVFFEANEEIGLHPIEIETLGLNAHRSGFGQEHFRFQNNRVAGEQIGLFAQGAAGGPDGVGDLVGSVVGVEGLANLTSLVVGVQGLAVIIDDQDGTGAAFDDAVEQVDRRGREF
jgi:hypothetical protein